MQLGYLLIMPWIVFSPPDKVSSARRQPAVFVSYSREDSDVADQVAQCLSENEIVVWIDRADIVPGSEWMAETLAAIRHQDMVVFLASTTSLASKICQLELLHAYEHGKRIVSVSIDAENAVPDALSFIGARQWVFVADPDWQRDLLTAVKTDFDRLRSHTQLDIRATEWDSKGRSRRGLLRGSDLKEAKGIVRTGDLFDYPVVTELQRSFYDASCRRATWMRRGSIIVSLAIVGTLIASVLYAIDRGQEAEASQRMASAEDVRARAQEIVQQNPRLALQLSMIAYSIHPTPTTKEQLVGVLANSRHLRTLSQHADVVSSTIVSPDGRTLATTDWSGTTILWDLADANDPHELTRLKTNIQSSSWTAVAFGPDGKTLITAGKSTGAVIWDIGDRRHPRRVGEIDEDSPWSFAISGDGRAIAIATGAQISLWSMTVKPRRLDSTGYLGSSPTLLGFFHDHQILVTHSDRSVILWRVTKDKLLEKLGKPLRGPTNVANSAALTLDGSLLALGTYDGTVTFWDLRDPALPRQLGKPLKAHTANVASLAFSADGQILATGSDQTAALWNMRDPRYPQPIGYQLAGHTGYIGAVTFTPDGKTLVTGSNDKSIRTWTVDHPTRPIQIGGPWTGDAIRAKAVAISSSPSRPLRIPSPILERADPKSPVAFTPDGKVVAIISHADTTVMVWDISDVDHPRALPISANATMVHVTADRKLICIGAELSTWALPDGGKPMLLGRSPLSDDTHQVDVAAVSDDGRTLATSGPWPEGTIVMWDISDAARARKVANPFFGHAGSISGIALSHDGSLLATGGSEDHHIIIWDVSDRTRSPRQIGQPLQGHDGAVTSLVFAPNGDTLASGGFDGKLFLWNLKDSQRIQQLGDPVNEHNAVDSVAFSPDSARIAVEDHIVSRDIERQDRTVRLWNLVSLDLLRNGPIRLACARIGQLDREIWLTYAPSIPFKDPCKVG